MDIIVDYADFAKKNGIRLDYHYPTFTYAYLMKHHSLIVDNDLMLMFERFSAEDVIDIWVGTTLKPNALYKLVLNLRRNVEKEMKMVPSTDELQFFL